MARVLPFSVAAAEAARAAPPVAKKPLLGDLLVEAGALDADALAEALVQQGQQDQRDRKSVV